MSNLNLDCALTASFISALEILPDPRDTRGKKHNLAFVVCGVASAIMAGRATVSGIERFIRNRIAWLVELTGLLEARPISRAHLPRLLACIDWYSLNPIIEEYFGLRIELNAAQEWTAVDGKTLRGTTSAQDKQGQRTLLAVTHTSKTILAQSPLPSQKAALCDPNPNLTASQRFVKSQSDALMRYILILVLPNRSTKLAEAISFRPRVINRFYNDNCSK